MRKIAIFFVTIFFASSLFAQSATSELQKRLDSFSSMRADFQQIVVSGSGKVLQNATGQLVIQRPGKFYWHVIKPMEQVIVTNGKKLWIYEPDLQQMTVRRLDESLSQTPIALLTQTHTYLNKAFSITEPKPDLFNLKPREAEQGLHTVVLSFSNDTLKEMRLGNDLGQHTTITFNHVEINPDIDDGLFTIHVPSDVDVVDQTVDSE